MNLLELIPTVGSLVDKFVADPNKAMELKLELAKIDASETVARQETLRGMLSNKSVFVSGAIPSLIWIAVLSILNNYVLMPWVSLFGATVPQVSLPSEYWSLLTTVIVGLFGKKLFDNNEIRYPSGQLLSPSRKDIEVSVRRTPKEIEARYQELVNEYGKEK